MNLLASHGLLPTFTTPTRYKTCIDHVIIKTRKPAKAFVIVSSLTDHSAVADSLQNLDKVKGTQSISKINYNTLEYHFNKSNFDVIYDFNCPNKVANLIVDIISRALVASTQILRIPHRRLTIKLWITAGILRCMRNRDNMNSKLKLQPNNEILRTTYKRYRNYCNDLLKKLKRQYESNELQKAGKDSKRIWEIVKRSYEEVAITINSLKSDCAKGWDNIHSKILKQYQHILVTPITYLCNICLDSGIFPDAFKKSIIKPIFKSGDRDRVTNYRPISILLKE